MPEVIDIERLTVEIADQHARDYDSIQDTVLSPAVQLNGKIGEPLVMSLESRASGIYYALTGEDYTERSQLIVSRLTSLVRTRLREGSRRDG